MKIGILAGVFDPPQVYHLTLAQQVLVFDEVDCVWFVPIWMPEDYLEAEVYVHRLAMVYHMISGHDHMHVHAYASYSHPTKLLEVVTELKHGNPDKDFRLIYDTNKYQVLPKEEKLKMHRVFEVCPPVWKAIPCLYSESVAKADLKAGKDSKFIPDSVRAYIKKHDLYENQLTRI